MRTVAGGSDAQGGKQPGEEEEEEEEGGGMMKFRGVKERVTAPQTLHAAW